MPHSSHGHTSACKLRRNQPPAAAVGLTRRALATGGIGSIYCPTMVDPRAPTPAAPAAIDAQALAHVLARQARAAQPPWLHQEVARRMAQRLPVIKQPPHTWLDWWAHTGAGAPAVAAIWPQAQRSVAEPTAALAERSRAALAAPWWAWGRRRDQAVTRVWLDHQVPLAQADMLWANLCLHAGVDATATLAAWHRALSVGGFVMFSSYGPDTLRELRELYAQQGWPAPHPPYADMHNVGDALLHGGFADPVMDQEVLQLTWSSPQALLAELRGLGGHLAPGCTPGLRTVRWRERLLQALARRADAQGRITMSFELVYGHAYKATPRTARGDLATVSLEALRATLPQRNPGPARIGFEPA